MKLFKVSACETGYGEYKSIIVIAEHKERALQIAKQGQAYDWKNPDQHEVYWNFNEDQYPLDAVEINLSVEKVILSELIGS